MKNNLTTTLIGWLNDLWRFNLSDNQWAWISGSTNPDQPTINREGQGKSPGARSYHSMTLDPAKRTIYVFGGRFFVRTGLSKFLSGHLNELWSFNLATNAWKLLGGNDQSCSATTGHPV